MQYRSKGLQLVQSRLKNVTPLAKQGGDESLLDLSERRSQSSDISNNSQPSNIRENNVKTQLLNNNSQNDRGKSRNEMYVDNFNTLN